MLLTLGLRTLGVASHCGNSGVFCNHDPPLEEMCFVLCFAWHYAGTDRRTHHEMERFFVTTPGAQPNTSFGVRVARSGDVQDLSLGLDPCSGERRLRGDQTGARPKS